MKSFREKESICVLEFNRLGDCYHLWTPENFDIIFNCDDDFKDGMGIIAVAAALFPDIRIITFELMSNHLHIAAAGREERLRALAEWLKKILMRFACCKGRTPDWKRFDVKMRKMTSIEDFRNVIVYDNKNGYVVSPAHTPFSYPWGANRYYFNPDAWELAQLKAKPMTVNEIRRLTHSRVADKVKGLLCLDGYALPVSFCDIKAGERLFRDASHYFSKLSRSIETSREIAREIGESIFYNDSELYASICALCRKQYGEAVPSRITAQQKIEMARTMRFEYNASAKQIQRVLKLDTSTLGMLGF